jgi:hypothetical protein
MIGELALSGICRPHPPMSPGAATSASPLRGPERRHPSVIFLAYTGADIAKVFFITAATSGA